MTESLRRQLPSELKMVVTHRQQLTASSMSRPVEKRAGRAAGKSSRKRECGKHYPAFKNTSSVADFLARIGKHTRHDEHDSGSFDRCDREVWFKIDYFDSTLEQVSPDRADPAVTKRIMTIGLAQDRRNSGSRVGKPSFFLV
jgi:hypothetical protein